MVVQQDNAGPHIEEEYKAWMQEQFADLGWMYEPQAPRGAVRIYFTEYQSAPNLNMLAIV